MSRREAAPHFRSSANPRRGVVLIVVLGILVVLALLGTTFAIIQSIDRQVSHNYLDDVRAKLLAQSGVEYGFSWLKQNYSTDLLPSQKVLNAWKYYGNDTSRTGMNPALLNVPLEKAQSPSLDYENSPVQNPFDPDPNPPRLVTVEGQPVGFSGMMDSGTYGLHSDHYSLKITDLQSLIHVNDGVENGANGSVSQNLKRILNNLGKVVGVPNVGDMIVNNRPPRGYKGKGELLAALGYSQATFDKIKDFVTVAAWQDKNVANPVPLSSAVLSEYPVTYYRGTGVYRYGKGKDSAGFNLPGDLVFCPPAVPSSLEHAIYAFDELNPQYVEIVSRAPININAAPREVLISLLAGLKAFFVLERRRNNPLSWVPAYEWLPVKHTFSPAGSEGDEVGFLFKTVDIVGPGSGTTTAGSGSISASAIADEIIACRNQTASGTFNYATVPWGGTFKTWRQFYQFCDNLVTTGVLVDNRPHYFDYNPSSGDPTGAGPLMPSAIQKKRASRALADMLKANFNPNLHINTLNMDANLHLLVDKTSMISNSTEFCFTPMGLFEIQSVGRVLQPVDSQDAFTAGNNKIVATKKITAVVKLFDAYRETDQKQFAAGTLSERAGSPETNNNYSVEVGPEPDNGSAPSENEYDGYIALPTIGGNYKTIGQHKAAGALVKTPGGSSELGEVLHSHFTWDFDLHYHVDGIRQELARNTVSNEENYNFPDKTESVSPPYDPTWGTPNRFRLCRSFRMPAGTGTTALPALSAIAPSNLHIDGGYSERHSGLAYWMSSNVIGASIGTSQGTAAYWFKPNWYPEMTGKPRLFLNMDRYQTGNSFEPNPSPFVHFYFASQDAPAYSTSTTELAMPAYTLFPFGVNPARPSSMAFGYGFSANSGYGGRSICEGGYITPCLNHLSHPDSAIRSSPLQAHRWVHVAMQWNVQDQNAIKLYVDGQLQSGGTQAWYSIYDPGASKAWFQHDDGRQNSVRVGAVSKFTNSLPFYERNWSSDATIDELYFWNSTGGLNNALSLWHAGRYYKPINGTGSGSEGIFLSQELKLLAGVARTLPPPSSAVPPSTTGSGTGVSTTTATAAVTPKVRLVGVSWTWMAEAIDPVSQKEILHDYLPGADLHPSVEMSVVVDGVTYPVVKNAAYSPLKDTSGGPITVNTSFKYKAQIRVPDAQIDSILLATPFVDDITIYYDDGGPPYVSYYIE